MIIDLIVGARPNFVKAAPVLAEFRRRGLWDVRLIHTGQHYDDRLSALFFEQLSIPEPDVNLQVGSGTHTTHTARVMLALEERFTVHPPDMVMVFGDVNSTLAGAIVASKMQIVLCHVEAGLRSFDRTMPEEINRVLTDAVSDLLFITEPEAAANLDREGVGAEKIHFVGNTMIDTLLSHRDSAARLRVAHSLGLDEKHYVVVTLHRPSNVDGLEGLTAITTALLDLAVTVPVVFPVHPRTRQRLQDFGLWQRLADHARIRLIEPLGYLHFLDLLAGAAAVLTDSGGIQEETTILKVPCVTLRTSTERPITVTVGSNTLVGDDPARALEEINAIVRGERRRSVGTPDKWDGKAARRIADVIQARFGPPRDGKRANGVARVAAVGEGGAQ